ncbi:MAG TPA: hypothetical protein VGG28_14025 [Kofleriaceae bacterium]
MKLALAIVALVASPAIAGPGWELHVPERIEIASGNTGALALDISLDRGETISKDAGLVLDLAPDGGVTLKHRRLSRADAVDPDADALRFSIPLHAEAAGDFTLKLHVRFWLCGSKVCRPIDARRTIAISVAKP